MARFLFPTLGEKQCMTCHDDYHRGQLGTACEQCHTVERWKKIHFDHNKQSRFPLLDKHAVVACTK